MRTVFTKLRDFQYMLLSHNIYLNLQLLKCKIKESKCCNFCNCVKETLTHFLYKCRVTQEIWRKTEQFILEHVQLRDTLDISCLSIIFNIVYPQPQHILNTIILIVKQYPSGVRCLKLMPKWSDIHSEIYNIHIGGSRGGAAGAPPPTGSISFVFAYVFVKKYTCRRLAPPPPPTGRRPPPTGNPGSATDYLHSYELYYSKVHGKLKRHCKKWAPLVEEYRQTNMEERVIGDDYLNNYINTM